MAITKLSSGSSFTNLTKYDSFLAGNPSYAPPSYDSIATVIVGSGGAANITFSSIPSGYTDLQIRLFVRPTSTSNGPVFMQCNGDTGSNYTRHSVRGDGTTLFTSGTASTTSMYFNGFNTYAGATDRPTISIIDILDYKNTNKYKTVRTLAGLENNGSGEVGQYSGMWMSTNAITSIKLFDNVNYGEYTKAALYGIKG